MKYAGLLRKKPSTAKAARPAASYRSEVRQPGLLRSGIEIDRATSALERQAGLAADAFVGSRAIPQLSVGTPGSPAQKTLDGEAADTGGVHAAAAAVTGGEPLTSEIRAPFEQRFGRDFSEVRIHTEPRAQQAARSIGARAYTMGRHIAFAAGAFSPHSYEGHRLIAHELAHVAQQMSGAGPVIQRDIADADLPRTPVEQILADPTYFENGIERIEYFAAELARLHYPGGSTIDLGLVPDQIEPPFEAVDYRTPRAEHAPVSPGGGSLGTGQIEFVPRARSIGAPPGTSHEQVIAAAKRTIRFTRHTASGRIVPTEVNSISAPRLSQALRDTEAQYVAATDEMARGMIKVLNVMSWIIILRGMLGGGPRSGGARPAAGAGAAGAGILGRATARLANFFAGLLRSGATAEITVEGVGFGGVRVALQGTELVVIRNTIVNVGRVAGRGRLMHGAFEQAAIQVARQSGATTARVALQTVQNPAWRAYLESLGYSAELLPTGPTTFSNVLTKVFTL